jgi:hypothetical protein
MCLIYLNTSENQKYIFIHIPKNSGSYLREKIKKNTENTIIKNYWNVSNGFDLAHIPFSLLHKYISNFDLDQFKIIAYSRNPYHRLISAFLYRTNLKVKNYDLSSSYSDFKLFVKNELDHFNFDQSYKSNIIHYYPQYLFLVDNNIVFNSKNIEVYKIENKENPKFYDLNKYYDSETLMIVNKIYANDFKYFNYEMKWFP